MVLILALLSVLSGVAQAGPATTRDALDRLEEILELRVEDGTLSPDAVLPAILVSAQPRYEDSLSWFSVRAIEALQGAFGSSGLRLCEACMAPRTHVAEGSMRYQAGPISLDEIVRLDDLSRGTATAARSAVWIDEHRGGVAVRIVDLRTGRVLYAQNIDPDLIEVSNTERVYRLSEELERRSRGDAITQAFVDVAIYPGQHISLDWTEQWGKSNAQMSGITISLFDPVFGLGASHYRAVDFFDILVGGKLIVSIPTALVASFGEIGDVLDPRLTAVGIVRVPFGGSNYGGVLSVSTNGQIGLGISLMNISLLPVLP
ncbi:MAG: hypothetical protein P8R54_30720 [Myxococcota bacterium]|nr:hypothetical protein [Myxococcota bacterium]